MFNSCTFNNLKYNSVCIAQPVAPVQPPTGDADVRVDRRKRRVFNREFFNIVGTKLFLNKEQIEIIGTKLVPNKEFIEIISTILLPEQSKIDLQSTILEKEIQEILFLQGKVLYPIKIETSMVGSKKFRTCMYQIVKGKRLILSKQLELIYGQSSIIEQISLKGSTLIPCKQHNLIRGKKDITRGNRLHEFSSMQAALNSETLGVKAEGNSRRVFALLGYQCTHPDFQEVLGNIHHAGVAKQNENLQGTFNQGTAGG